MKGSTAFTSSLVATPSTVKPLSAYCCCILISIGISPRQGSHQVPQKFTRTTFPLKLERATLLPCKSLKVTSGSSAREAAVVPEELPADLLLLVHPEKLTAAAKITIADRNAL